MVHFTAPGAVPVHLMVRLMIVAGRCKLHQCLVQSRGGSIDETSQYGTRLLHNMVHLRVNAC